MTLRSPNVPPELVNTLVQHRIDAMNRRVPQPREPVAALVAACDCPSRPLVASYTAFRRYACPCGRRWTYRPAGGWTRAA